MPKNALRKDEIEQWTHGRPNTISEILLNGLALLKETTTERTGAGADAIYKVDKTDVTALYNKVTANIFQKFAIRGEQKLAIRERNKPEIDGSALLGAYFRSSLIGADEHNIVELNDQELQAIYDFVEPLVPAEPPGFTPKMWLDSFEGSAHEKHKKVLTALIFHGITEEQKASMFKEKYKGDVDNMLDSMLNIVDFMRTPFRVLDSEEAAIKLLAKKQGGQAKLSGIDLQWTSMLKAFQTSMDSMITHKHPSKQRDDAVLIKDGLHETLMWCQGSFGIENARYQMKTEFAKEAAKDSQIFKQIQAALGFAGDDPETALPIISAYVHDFRENIIKSNAEKAEEIRAMPLTQLFTEYADLWQKRCDSLSVQLVAAQKETSEVREQVSAKQLTIEQQTAQLSEIGLALESSKKQVLALEKQLKETTERAKLDIGKLSKETQQTIQVKSVELESTRQKMQALEERFRIMELRVQEAERLSQQKESVALALEKQLAASKLNAEQQSNQLIEINQQLRTAKEQVLLLKIQLKEMADGATEDTSIVSNISQPTSSELELAQQRVHDLEEQLHVMTQKAQETELQSQQIQKLLLQISALEEQLLLAKQTKENSSTVEALEEQLRKVQLQNTELLSQLKLAQSPKESVVEDHTHELEEMRQEIIKLKQQLELAHVGSEKTVVLDVHPKAKAEQIELGRESFELQRKKSKLSFALGKIAVSLKDEDVARIQEQIDDSKSAETLNLPDHEIQSLSKINEFMKEINKGILKRAHWYTSDPQEKITAIEHAFKALSMEQKVKLMFLTDEEIKIELKKEDLKNDPIGVLLQELHHNRSWIPFSEATSFTLFKSGIKSLSAKITDDVRELGIQSKL